MPPARGNILTSMADNEAKEADMSLGLGDTALGTVPPGGTTAPAKPALGLTMRSTVLPRLVPGTSAPQVAPERPRFEPLRLLGQGGIGEVTLVRDNDIDRPVALKRLRTEAQSDEGLHRFVHEIRTVGQLDHPNIAPIHDVGIDDHGRHYFVMRYVEGETIESIINKLLAGEADYHRRFTFEHRVQIFVGVLNAVNYAHSKQIIHRDIKPSNIMVGPYGEVVVMDWGVAKKKSAPTGSTEQLAFAATLDPAQQITTAAREDAIFRTRHGSLVGTPAYMSPEQAGGRTDEIDERSDVYSLCVLFYELLTLQHYLPGRGTVQEMLASVMKDRETPASHVRSPHQPVVPAELQWFLAKGLEKKPADRYQTVGEMIEELQRVVAGGFAVHCYVTFIKRSGNSAVKFTDRHPRLALSTVVAVLGFAAFGVVALLVRLLA